MSFKSEKVFDHLKVVRKNISVAHLLLKNISVAHLLNLYQFSNAGFQLGVNILQSASHLKYKYIGIHYCSCNVIRFYTKILKYWIIEIQKYWTTESSPMHGPSWESIPPGNTLLQMQLIHWNTKVALNHWKFSKQCMVPKCISRCPTTFHYCNVWESISCRLPPKYEYIRKALQLRCFRSAYKIPRDKNIFWNTKLLKKITESSPMQL